MQWKEDEHGVEEGEKWEEEEGKTVCWPPNKFLPMFRLPSPAASKTLRLRIGTINTQAVRNGEKNTYHHLHGYAERTNAPIKLPCSEKALATLKHFKN